TPTDAADVAVMQPRRELDEPDELSEPAPYATEGTSAGPWRAAALLFLLLLIAVCGALYQAARHDYKLDGRWPFLHDRPPAVLPVQSLPAVIDFGALEYDNSRIVTSKSLRGAPLTCDTAGNVYAITQPGKIIRISPAGAISG